MEVIREKHKYNKELKTDAGSSYSFAWDVMMKNFGPLLAVVIIVIILSLPISIQQNININANTNNWSDVMNQFRHSFGLWNVIGGIFVFIYSIFFLTPVKYGADLIIIKACRGEDIELRDLFSGLSSKHYLNIIISYILLAAITLGCVAIAVPFIILSVVFFAKLGPLFILLGILALIPSIIVAIRLSMVSFLVMDKNMDAIAAIKESWRMTRKHSMTIVAMALLAIPITILALMFCWLCIPILMSGIWITTAFGSLYLAIYKEEEESV